MPTYIYRIQPVRPAMLSEGPTADETRITGEHTENDPGVAQKLFRAEWYPYRVALHAPENGENE